MVRCMVMMAKVFMSCPNQSKRAGFTLIELMITTTLGLLLLGAAAASYSTFGVRQARTESAREVMSLLRRAQQRARSGDKPVDGCTHLDGYRVWGQQGTQAYNLSLRCNGNGQDYEQQEFVLREQEFFQEGFDVTFSSQIGPVPNTPTTVKIGPLVPGESHYEFIIERNGLVTDVGIIEE